MAAYYNEFDPFAAQWLRNLVAAGQIAAGDVDERSIADVQPDDLRGYTQCHFFAGIGRWSYALRLAGWPDDRPVWTGSCPCQPFSAAGRQKGEADERHLWPEFRHLIAECGPAVVFGEQVASKLGRGWLAGVRSDLEALGFAVGAADLGAASVGAPHIRQRLFWVADSNAERHDGRGTRGAGRHEPADGRGHVALADASSSRSLPGAHAGIHRGEEGAGPWNVEPQRHCGTGSLALAGGEGLEGRPVLDGELRAERQRAAVERGGEAGGLGEPDGAGPFEGQQAAATVGYGRAAVAASGAGRMADTLRPGWAEGRTGTGDGSSPWSGGTLIPCADGKARRVGPGVFPLAHGVSARVGRLRGYGNAIVAPLAAEFIKAAREAGIG